MRAACGAAHGLGHGLGHGSRGLPSHGKEGGAYGQSVCDISAQPLGVLYDCPVAALALQDGSGLSCETVGLGCKPSLRLSLSLNSLTAQAVRELRERE